ncbi:AraC family transcriptional regulator [Alkalihalobacillus oceani]|uniref:AraC family transcriptional regulator n=1 Tax=Halalkalibacter oceani TaxID=1653776 RepID=A0A9X2DSV4_9BACI|nr:AraC family transcriptional regulator [Halalkalibacter oceani]
MKITMTKQMQLFIESLGISIDALLKKANIADARWQHTLTISDLDYVNLLQELDQLLTDEQLVVFSQIENLNMFIPPLFAALTAKNGYEGIQRLQKYKRLIGPMEMNVIETGQTLSITFSFVRVNQELPRFALLAEQLLLVSLVRTGTGENVMPLMIEGPYSYGAKIEEWLGVSGIKSVKNRLVFKKEDVMQPFLTENNVMWGYLEPEFTKRLYQVSTEKTFSQNVQAKLFSAIPSGSFTVKDVAKSMGISVRTLQRNLAAENTTFQKQLQIVQQQLAFHYLQRSDLTTDDISYLLGYADTNSFVRAFKRWTGKTLSEYRLPR